MNEIIDLIGLDNVLETLQGKSGVFVSILVTIGALRLTVKPLLSLLHSYTEKTPTKVDDAFLEKIENSKVLKIIFYLIDWISSVKIVPKKVERIDIDKMGDQEEAKWKMNPFAAILSIIADLFSFGKKQYELKNTADMKEAKKKQDELTKIDYITDRVAHQDINEVRKILSE